MIKILGEVIHEYRKNNTNKSLNTFAYEYELSPGNISRIERGQIEAKFTMLWRIAEALNVPLSKIIKQVEDALNEEFSITDK